MPRTGARRPPPPISLCFRKGVSGKSGPDPEISWKEMWLLLALLSIFQGTPALSLEASEEMEQGMASKVGEGGRDVREWHQKLERILALGPKKEAAGQGDAIHCFPLGKHTPICMSTRED